MTKAKPFEHGWILEPDEPRGSRPVLGERGGETPPRHSPKSRFPLTNGQILFTICSSQQMNVSVAGNGGRFL